MRELVPIVPPKQGLNDAKAYSEQPPQSTSLSRNMRTQQASTGRLRVSQRAGYRLWSPRAILTNRLAFTEDLSHFRDTVEGDRPFPVEDGWTVAASGGAGSFSSTADGTLGPDRVSPAQLAKQLLAGSGRAEVGQTFDPLDPPTSLLAKAGATWLRTASRDLMFSVYMKVGDATTTQLSIRQGTTVEVSGAPFTRLTITWTAGVASITATNTGGSGSHQSGLTDEGNGWYRIWASITWNLGFEPTAPTLRCLVQPNLTDTTVKGTYLWGAQLELVPTATTEPTRYEPVLGKNDTLGTRKGAALHAVNHLQRRLDYRRRQTIVADRSVQTPAKASAYAIAYDRQRNRYLLEAQAVVKYSSQGTLIFSIPVPIDDPNHVCQALHLDEVDQIYVGVTSGGDAAKARLFCFRQGPEVVGGEVREDSHHLHWSVLTGQYVVNIKSHEGVLYTLQDDPTRTRSELVMYDALDFAEPEVALRKVTPYPSAGMAIKSDGSIVTCHTTNLTRGLDPSANGSDTLGPWPTAVGWTPENNQANYATAAWARLRSDYILGPGRRTIDDFDADEEVTDWVDHTGKQRNAYKFGGGLHAGPTANLRGMSGIPGVKFNGIDQALTSNPNPGTDETNLDLHRTLIPSYDGAKSTTFVVFRPAFKAVQGAVIGQPMTGAVAAPANHYVVCANRDDTDTIAAPSRGRVSLYDDTTGSADVAVGTGAQPQSALIESGGLVNFCIMAMKRSAVAAEGEMRVNGSLIEPTYASIAAAGEGATTLGYYEQNSGFGFFEGELLEVLVYNSLLSTTDVQLHEGYFANYYGGQGRLDAAHPYKLTPGAGLLVPSTAPIPTGKADVNKLNHRSTILAKFAPGGDLKWTVVDYFGVGYDVALDPSGNIFSLGEYNATEGAPSVGTPALPANRGEQGWLRKVIDNGESADPDDFVADWTQNKLQLLGVSVGRDFSDAFWTKTNVTVTTNTTGDPIGSSTADTLTTTVAGGTVRRDFAAATLIEASDYVFSVYLKVSTATVSRVKLSQSGGTGSIQVDYTHATRAATPTVAGTGHRYRWDVTDQGNGWTRIQVSMDYKAADSTTLRLEILPDTTGTAACFAWGAMFERGQIATPVFLKALDGVHRPKDSAIPVQLGTSYPRMDVDTFGNVMVPGPWATDVSSALSRTMFTARVYDKNLYLRGDLDINPAASHTVIPGRGIVVNREPPSYIENNPGMIRNLLGFSERFDNAYWTKTNVTVTANAALAPDGLFEADNLADSSASVQGTVIRELTTEIDTGEVYTFSAHFLPVTATTTRLVLEHTAGAAQSTEALITWNVATGRAPIVTLTNAGSGVHTYELEPAENGYFRLSVSLTYDSLKGSLRVRINPDGTNANTGSVRAWGVQLERSDVMTPYQRIDGRKPFQPVLSTTDPIELTDHMSVATLNDDVESSITTLAPTLYEVPLVDSDPNGLAARTTKMVTVARGSIVVVDRIGEHQTPRGGSSCLDQNARYISVTSLYQRLIATDGTRSVIYEPHVDGQVRAYKATTGEVPEGVELWTSWRGRAVALRTRDDPHAWFMSAIEDVRDWDYFTPPLHSSKAVFSTTSRAGLAPDIINTAIPYDDERLILGCDHAIWYLPGDPLSERAQWQHISDITGISFGNHSWCKDDKGILYFFGSRGGFYAMPAGGGPQSLTTETIDRRLSAIDLDRYYVECFWNWREEGVNIYVIPFGAPGTIVAHFFWGRRFDEWRTDDFVNGLIQPTSAAVIDGEKSNDRRLLYVNGNLNILQWDETSKTDDGTAIIARERIGPYDVGGDMESRWNELTVLLSEDSDGARFEMFAADTADSPGAVKVTGLLGPGRNGRKFGRVRGSKFWLELVNDTAGQSFAFEEGGIYGARAGRARVR